VWETTEVSMVLAVALMLLLYKEDEALKHREGE